MEHHAVRCKTHFSVPAVGLVWVLGPHGCINIIVLPWFHPGWMVTWEGGGNVCCRGVGYSWVAPGEVSSLTWFYDPELAWKCQIGVSERMFFLSRCSSTGASVCWYLQSCWICDVTTINWCFLPNVLCILRISSVEISYSNKSVLKTPETTDRTQVASCVFPLPLILFFFLLWAWSNALAMNLHVNRNCVFGLLSHNSEEELAFASALPGFGDNWHWICAVCLSASGSLELTPVFTQAAFCSLIFNHSPVSVLLY